MLPSFTARLFLVAVLSLGSAPTLIQSAYELDGKQLFHLTTTPSGLETLRDHYTSLDIWQARPLGIDRDGQEEQVEVTIYATPSMLALYMASFQKGFVRSPPIYAARQDKGLDMDALITSEVKATAVCQDSTEGYLTRPVPSDPTTSLFFDCFRRATEITAFLTTLTTAYPTMMRRFVISTTVQGQPIYAYTLARPDSPETQQTIYVQGMLHAREWLGPPTLIYQMAALLADTRKEALLNAFTFTFVPIVNVDGYDFSWDSNRLWRKNRSVNEKSWWGQSYGVDLNRNYGPTQHHCGPGTSTNPSSDTFCGPAPMSEPELVGIDTYLIANPHIVGAIDIHTYGNLILRPYGHTKDDLDGPAQGKMEALGEHMKVEINAANAGRFTNIRASELYVAAGTFLDYYYEVDGAKPSITFELRGGNFIVDPSLIRMSGREIFQGLHVFAEECALY